MLNDLRIPLFISIALHVGIFIATSIHPQRTIYINIPVELMFNTIQAPEQPAPANTAVQAPKKDDEVAMPSKSKPQPVAKTEPVPPPPVAAAAPSSAMKATGQLTLESAKFPFAYYANQIRTKIDRNWQRSTEFERLKTVIYFRIERNGSLGSIRVKESSGDPLFDELAIRAIKLSEPFAPLPEAYEDDHLGVYFDFTFK